LFSGFLCNRTVTAKTAAKSKPANSKISETFDSPDSLKRKLKTIIKAERMVIENKPAVDFLAITKSHLNNQEGRIYKSKD